MIETSAKGFAQIFDRCLKRKGKDDDQHNGDKNSYTAIDLRENSDLCSYKNAFVSQKERVDEIISYAVDEEVKKLAENEPLTPSNIILVELPNVGVSINDNQHLFVSTKMQECILHENNQSFQGGNTICHYYFIKDDNKVKLKSLTVTVVCTGTFDGPRYNSGELSVELKRLSNTSDPYVSIGRVPDELQIQNTMNEIGRVIIQHEVECSVIECGIFELSVSAGAHASYSISIGGSFAFPLLAEIQRDMACFLDKQDEITECTKRSVLMRNKSALLERKKAIENKLIEETSRQCVKSEIEMQALDLELDRQDEMEDAGASIVKQLNDLKVQTDDSYRLLSLRSKLNADLSSEMNRVSEERALLRQRLQLLKNEVENSKAILSCFAESIWGDRTSKLIMSQLEPDRM